MSFHARPVGSGAGFLAARPSPPGSGSSPEPVVCGGRRLANSLVPKDFSGFAAGFAPLGSRVRTRVGGVRNTGRPTGMIPALLRPGPGGAC